ncbi:hypothetical protein ACGC1H_005225 [Rhizoctonia solani]
MSHPPHHISYLLMTTAHPALAFHIASPAGARTAHPSAPGNARPDSPAPDSAFSLPFHMYYTRSSIHCHSHTYILPASIGDPVCINEVGTPNLTCSMFYTRKTTQRKSFMLASELLQNLSKWL